ncbi:hypothetical protein DPEC_G00283360 [Dallia pectoralis]|uniref:Uncharacterized protein n=1 Tax=Dallia pectoralis TaxID=75939 RepID=A0ACC2FJ37_DALPE|nr:hypothetical protein DPEC_G00283360 [Dallia pectoralis]
MPRPPLPHACPHYPWVWDAHAWDASAWCLPSCHLPIHASRTPQMSMHPHGHPQAWCLPHRDPGSNQHRAPAWHAINHMGMPLRSLWPGIQWRVTKM